MRAEVRQVFENRIESSPLSDDCPETVRWIDVLSKVDLRAVTAENSPGGVRAKISGGPSETRSSGTWIDRAIGGDSLKPEQLFGIHRFVCCLLATRTALAKRLITMRGNASYS